MQITRLCNKCGKVCTTPLARLCDPCFEQGSKIQPPRQTGRTLKLLQQLDKEGGVLIVHNQSAVEHWRHLYPWLRNQIYSQQDAVHNHLLRARNGESVLVDHCCFEFPYKDFVYEYRMICAPR